jgi:hypothetical protein
VLKARLDAKMETPYLRAFSLNPKEYCMTHRQEMVVAALTLVRAWFAAGCPRVAQGNTASFEEWDHLVRQPLACLAQHDLVWGEHDTPSLCDVATVFAEAAAESPHKEKLRAVLHAWRGCGVVGRRVTARDLLGSESTKGFGGAESHDKLVEAITDAVGAQGQRPNATALGYWLKKHAGERMDGLCFERDGEISGSAAYVLLEEGS